jgi:hypothetical protein
MIEICHRMSLNVFFSFFSFLSIVFRKVQPMMRKEQTIFLMLHQIEINGRVFALVLMPGTSAISQAGDKTPDYCVR